MNGPQWPFREIWLVDFEFIARSGNRPKPVCLVALELRSRRIIRQWQNEFGRAPPYSIDAGSLFIAYYASAELGCHLALGWQLPARVLDLYVEFRNRTNGLETPSGSGLIGALTYFGLDTIGVVEKAEMRDLILRGGAWTTGEQVAILDYCEGDVRALERLLPVMALRIDLSRALLRGRYMAAVARMEWAGVPIDMPPLELLREHWDGIQDALVAEIDAMYGVFEGHTFKRDYFGALLAKEGIPWPLLESGRLDLSDDTFRLMARVYPALSPLRELRSTLADLRLNDLAVGHDGRNRTLLSPFRARSGRNQPSNTKFIFGPSVWLRGLIRPPEGQGLAYIDWEQQEFGIAAALSGDRLMCEAYNSGDPYLAFAKQAGAIPPEATRETHPIERELFKQVVLAVQYGSLRNFPMQANGAEMLRLACCLATERGIEVCAPIHDALLIAAPSDRLKHDVAATQAAMAEASRIVLDGFELRTDAKVIAYPDRYADPRGTVMWERVMKLVARCGGAAIAA